MTRCDLGASAPRWRVLYALGTPHATCASAVRMLSHAATGPPAEPPLYISAATSKHAGRTLGRWESQVDKVRPVASGTSFVKDSAAAPIMPTPIPIRCHQMGHRCSPCTLQAAGPSLYTGAAAPKHAGRTLGWWEWQVDKVRPVARGTSFVKDSAAAPIIATPKPIRCHQMGQRCSPCTLQAAGPSLYTAAAAPKHAGRMQRHLSTRVAR